MSKDRPRNLPASIRERLRKLASAGKEDFQPVLTRYGLERPRLQLRHGQETVPQQRGTPRLHVASIKLIMYRTPNSKGFSARLKQCKGPHRRSPGIATRVHPVMLQKLPLKKLAVELRYKPDLAFYGRMDAIGLELAGEYSDWQRTPLTLEVRNKKKHRRLFLSYNRAFLDVDEVDSDGDFSHAEKLMRTVCPKLEVKQFLRIGVRQWLAADLEKPFALMVDELAERFLLKNAGLSAVLSDKTKDVAYVVDYEVAEGWRYSLRLGPMMKSQWFVTVLHDPNAFEQPEEGEETFAKFQKTFPEQFLYIDIDCYQEDQPADKLGKFLESVRRRSHDLAAKLIEYCKK